MIKAKFSTVLLFSTLFIVTINPPSVRGEIKKPDYSSTIKSLQIFYPGQSIKDIEKIRGKGEIYSKRGEELVYQYKIDYFGYDFPILIQVKEGVVLGLWASLPTYFVHDIFHKQLIEMYGKQDHYFKKENSALYLWRDEDGNSVMYSGQCTLTCFSSYIFVVNNKLPKERRTLLKQFRDFRFSTSGD